MAGFQLAAFDPARFEVVPGLFQPRSHQSHQFCGNGIFKTEQAVVNGRRYLMSLSFGHGTIVIKYVISATGVFSGFCDNQQVDYPIRGVTA